MDFNDVANTLYGPQGAGNAPTNTQAPPARSAHQAGPERDVEAILYGPALPDVDLDALQHQAMVPSEHREAGSRRFRASLHDLGLDTLDSRMLVNKLADHFGSPRDERQLFDLQEDAKDRLSKQLGHDWQREVEAVATRLQRHPEVLKMLQETGVLHDAEVLLALVGGARRARVRGG